MYTCTGTQDEKLKKKRQTDEFTRILGSLSSLEAFRICLYSFIFISGKIPWNPLFVLLTRAIKEGGIGKVAKRMC
jgi:hypothetical protein